jgi:cobaltochelatase CobN
METGNTAQPPTVIVSERNLVRRADGKIVTVPRPVGQLFVCATGCCCGDASAGFAPVLTDVYETEWERRRLPASVHLTLSGCLGPCSVANVVMLLFDGHMAWFHSFDTESQIVALYDYIDAMLAAQSYLSPPESLAAFQFSGIEWPSGPREEQPA